jgi:PPM family protein phosphatase
MGKDLTLVTTDTDEQLVVERVKHAAGSDVGRRREENQDSFGIIEMSGGRVYLVADGMGGVQGGAIASQLAIEAITRSLKQSEEIGKAALEKALRIANEAIFQYGQDSLDFVGMGTTIVGLAFIKNELYVCNVGDSRAYRFRDGVCTQLTSDHTVVQDLIRAGSLLPEQAGSHPISHMLTRSLGPSHEVQVDCEILGESPREGDLYVLCSDGLHNMVTTEEIEASFDELTLDEAVQDLISLANLRGGTDNVTLIAVEIGVRTPLGNRTRRPSRIGASASTPFSALPPKRSKNQSHSDLQDNAPKPLLNYTLGGQQLIQPKERKSLRMRLARPHRSAGMSILFLALVLGFGIGAIVSDKLFQILGVEPVSAVQQQVESPFLLARQNLSSLRPEAVKKSSSTLEYVEQAAAAAVDKKRSGERKVELRLPAVTTSAEIQTDTSLIKRPIILTDIEKAQLLRRRATLEGLMKDIEIKLHTLGKPLQGTLGENLQKTAFERREVMQELQAANRKLEQTTSVHSVWRSRLQLFQETDYITAARLLAEEDPEIAKALQSFEKVMRTLIQSDSTKGTKDSTVAESAVTELANTVLAYIKSGLANAERAVAELAEQRLSLRSHLANLQREEEFTRTLLSQSVQSRRAMKDQLEIERRVTEAQMSQVKRSLELAHIPVTQ